MSSYPDFDRHKIHVILLWHSRYVEIEEKRRKQGQRKSRGKTSVVAPRGKCDRQHKTKNRNNTATYQQIKTENERKKEGLENRSTTKAPLRQPQQFCGASSIDKPYLLLIVGLVQSFFSRVWH